MFKYCESSSAVKELNNYLQDHSYLNGYKVGVLDFEKFSEFISAPNPETFPHAARWFNHILSLKRDGRAPAPLAHQNGNSGSHPPLHITNGNGVTKATNGHTNGHHAAIPKHLTTNRIPDTVAFLGPPSSFSHSAAETYFQNSRHLSPAKSIPGVFDMVLSGQTRFGVVPMENTIGGRIHQTLEGFGTTSVKIVGQIYLRISHHLVSRSPFESVKRIYSHPQALAQCSNFLLNRCIGAETIPTSSTARAAEMAAEEEGSAGISSVASAAHFGLNLLFTNIQDEEENVTRFFVISKTHQVPTGPDSSTFIILQTWNEAGSLAKVLLVFSNHNISLSRLDSFPSKNEAGVFNFLVEVKGDPFVSPLRDALPFLEEVTTSCRILGSFSDTNSVQNVGLRTGS